ncbi:hypothetical protein [Staphylococcus nepalensis]|uniref:hypothetical protein n=1 Tax=Staphylococcus nepalensis TaxID=214473 RepID=UPI000D58AC39|nr:hypothetical protein [Staphylococcus nepalensis]AWI44131.1 hypothetical protein BJG88_04785 [Staphylococcus nepalensis]SUM67730.1 Uncharacterised protein [Staphylococcus nepalensis]SUM95277.1 Uncharacterised protein [Staphylococcus nepalensis]
MTDIDYPILERYMRNYHSMVDTYKNESYDMEELQYLNLESIVKGITEVYNDCDIKIQQIIKLTWWDGNNYTENVIADVIGISELTLRHAKEVILKRVAKAVEYV